MNAPLSNPLAKRAAILFALLLPVVTPSRAEPPPTTAPLPPANPAQPQPGKPREMARAEWVESNRTAPNGTQYQTFASKVLGHEVSYLVSLPPDYDKETTKRYPVLYWLHGMGGNQRGGAMMFVPHVQEAVQEGILSPTIVILVNGMVNAFYCDSVDGQVPMESVIIKDLIPHVDATYRTLAQREDRIIEGYSMGGFGAAHLGFKYPELFGTVVVNAGALIDPGAPLLARIFGNDPQRAAAEHPMQLARANADKLRGQTHIRIGCGSIDNLLSKNKALHELLDELHIPNEFEVVPDIAHDSVHYYQKLGPKVFGFHQKSLGAAGGAGN
jgi:enterochelin esterase-like enzyme